MGIHLLPELKDRAAVQHQDASTCMRPRGTFFFCITQICRNVKPPHDALHLSLFTFLLPTGNPHLSAAVGPLYARSGALQASQHTSCMSTLPTFQPASVNLS